MNLTIKLTSSVKTAAINSEDEDWEDKIMK